MSLITKTERNLTVNTPASRSTLSIKSIIKDLQDLDKSMITKKEFGEMEMELKKLKEENARIKADLEATEADRMLYYNQYHQNGKELRALKAEIKILKEENESMKQSSNVEELNSSILSKEDVDKLDEKLNYYCWPTPLNYQETDFNKLEHAENFNKDTYKEAVCIYIYWRSTILPSLAQEEQESFHICFGQQVYKILHMFAPDHHIHLALQC